MVISLSPGETRLLVVVEPEAPVGDVLKVRVGLVQLVLVGDHGHDERGAEGCKERNDHRSCVYASTNEIIERCTRQTARRI